MSMTDLTKILEKKVQEGDIAQQALKVVREFKSLESTKNGLERTIANLKKEESQILENAGNKVAEAEAKAASIVAAAEEKAKAETEKLKVFKQDVLAEVGQAREVLERDVAMMTKKVATKKAEYAKLNQEYLDETKALESAKSEMAKIKGFLQSI